jgi:hypothetical protein
MKNILKKFHASFLVALAFVSIAGISYVFAAPTQPPSSGSGVDLPLHIGSAGQTKAGDLTVSGTLTASGALNVGGTLSVPTVCLNGSCNSSWPSASVTPSSASGSSSYYFGSYYTYNNGYVFNVSGSATLSGSGSLINANLVGGCPCFWGYYCATNHNITVEITNFSSRTVSYTGTCTYNNSSFYTNGNFNFTGITI